MRYAYANEEKDRISIFYDPRMVEKLNNGKYQVWVFPAQKNYKGKICLMFSWTGKHEASVEFEERIPTGRGQTAAKKREIQRRVFLKIAEQRNREYDRLCDDIREIDAENWAQIKFWNVMRNMRAKP